MKDIAIDTFLCAKSKLNPNKRKNVYELFGFDFLIDEDFRVWLIEVNTNPYLGCPNDEMAILVPQMINEMCTLVVDPKCPPAVPPEIEDKRFELIFSEQQNVNQRRSFDLDFCYPVASLKPFIGKPQKPVAKPKPKLE
jgi:hypothetical protein